MAVSQVATSASYVGNGSTTQFPVPFKFIANGDLVVTSTPTGGSPSTLVLGVNYSVLGADNDAGGIVVMVTAPAAGTAILIKRVTSPVQPLVLTSQGAFPPVSITEALDRATLSEQETQARATALETSVATLQAQVATLQPSSGVVTQGTSLVIADTSPLVGVGSSTQVVSRSVGGVRQTSMAGGAFVVDDNRPNGIQAAVAASGLPSNTLTPVLSLGCIIPVTLDANLTVANETPGSIATGTRVRFVFTQDATGYRSVTWGANYKGVAALMARQGPLQLSMVEFSLNGDGTMTLMHFDAIDLRQGLSPFDWGATGDGVADDTVPLANCVAYAKGHAPVLPVLLNGKFLTQKPVVIDVNNFVMRGTGRAISGLVHNSTYCGPTICIVPGTSWAQMPTRAGLTTSGGLAMQLDGTSNYFLNFADSPTLSLNGLSQVCIEFFIKFDSVPGSLSNMLTCQGYSSIGGGLSQTFQLYVSPATAYSGPSNQVALKAAINIGGVSKLVQPGLSSIFLNTGTTYHVALTYDGSNVRLFAGGALQGTTAATGNLVSKAHEDMTVGASVHDWPELTVDASMPTGAIDSIRISSVARYTSPFTAPTAKFAGDANTLLTHNFDNEQRYFSVANVWSSGTPLPLWIPLRHNDAGGSLLTDITLENFGIQDLYQLRGGIQVSAASQTRLSGLTLTSSASGICLDNNCFTSYLSDIELSSGTGAGFGARFGLRFGGATGAGECSKIHMVGFRYGIVATPGWEFRSLYFAPNSDSVYSMLLIQTDVTMDGGDYTTDIHGLMVDDEAAAPGYIAGMRIQQMDLVAFFGGNFDMSTPGHTTAAIEVDGGRSLEFHGTAFASNVSATPFFTKIAAPVDSVQLFGCRRYKTQAPWCSDMSIITSYEKGKVTGLKTLATPSTAVADVNYTALVTDSRIVYTALTAGRTVTLPVASSTDVGQELTVKDEAGTAGASNITVSVASAGTIDGASSKVINANFGALRLYSNGTQWFTR